MACVGKGFGCYFTLNYNFFLGDWNNNLKQKQLTTWSLLVDNPATLIFNDNEVKLEAKPLILDGLQQNSLSYTWYSFFPPKDDANLCKPFSDHFAWQHETLKYRTGLMCVYIELTTSDYTGYDLLAQDDEQSEAKSKWLETIRECFYLPGKFDTALTLDGWDFDYNSLGYASNDPHNWITPLLSDTEIRQKIFANFETQLTVNCNSISATVAVFCDRQESNRCVPKPTVSYGQVQSITIAIKDKKGRWCVKWGYGPLLCSQITDFDSTTACQNKGLSIGKPKCYSLSQSRP